MSAPLCLTSTEAALALARDASWRASMSDGFYYVSGRADVDLERIRQLSAEALRLRGRMMSLLPDNEGAL